jgi:predicted nucleic acid-binding protein
MRAVLDTNVVVSALLWGGTLFKLLQAASDGDMHSTLPTLLRNCAVLAREHLTRRLPKQHASIEAIRLYGVRDSVTPTTPAVPTDADTTPSPRLSAGAALIVTGDRDLLILPRRGIRSSMPPRRYSSCLARERER